jgi:cytidine deaminase
MNYFDELERLLENSYSPFSHFSVASIVVTKSGNIYRGVNVESVAYPTTICAERNAIFSAVTDGTKVGEVNEVHILARDTKGELFGATPCGSCRQVIAEQSLNRATIYVYHSSKDITTYSISELLPDAFVSLE